MGVYAGPEISQSGLVFAFDMGNRLKSWKGAPVTNLAFGNFFSGNANFTVNQNVTDSMPDGSTGIARELNAQTVVDANRTVSIGSYSLTAGSTYTLSFYVKNISCTGFGGNLYSPTLLGSIASIIYPTITTGIWIRVETTFTVPTGSGSPVTVSPQVFRDGGFGLFRMCWLQLEERSFATPYVENSRSSTQAILDLTNISTVTATSLTYNSDNTFSFNGSSNYISFPKSSSIVTGGSISLSLWAKWTTVGTTTSTIQVLVDNNHSASPNQGFYLQDRPDLSKSLTFSVSPLLSTVQSTFQVGDGNWHHITATNDTITSKMYIDGVLNAQASGTGIISAQPSISIGNWGLNNTRFLNGNIAQISIYNRALSASEIQQNFNALRGRFGI